MIGAIFGDILGSISEEIPHHPLRTELTPTDDSFLTCACKDWIDNLTTKEISEFLINKKHTDMFDDYAVHSLKKWWKYFPEQGFSRNFNAWIQSKNMQRGDRGTNGCLMRNSPIAQTMVNKKFYLRTDVIEMAKVFASITHNNEMALKAVEMHTEMIFLGLLKDLNKDTIVRILTEQKILNFKLESVEYWKQQKEFIWDAPRSLSIAVSTILESNSYKETIDKCCYIGKDADTYAAIAGPIAETLWGIEDETANICLPILDNFPQIKKLYKLK